MSSAAEPVFEIPLREDLRPMVAVRQGPPWRAILLLLPAAAFVVVLLLVPLAATVLSSVRVEAGGFGLEHYAGVLADGEVRSVIGNSLSWIVLAPAVCVAGLALAQLARSAGPSRTVLISAVAAPVAVSALVGGVTFRLLFDPERGTAPAVVRVLARVLGDPPWLPDAATFLGPGRIGVVLASAFAWLWVGPAMVVFRAGLEAVPRDLLRVADAYRVGRLRRLGTVVLPALLPVAAVVLLTLLVASARVFELVLVAVPGSLAADTDVVGLHWWRNADRLGTGRAAALAVLLFVLVSAAALVAVWGLRRQWPTGRTALPPVAEPPRASRPRWIAGVAVVAAVALWLAPLLTLLLTSLRSPEHAAVAGWWAPQQGGPGQGAFASYAEVLAGGELWGVLASTASRAVSATVLLLGVAVLAAYVLAWGELSRRAVRALVTLLAVLAVLPLQAVAEPLQEAFARLRLLGAPSALTLVHVALGVPFAVLVLRTAFAAVPRTEVVRARVAAVDAPSAFPTVVARSWTAVLAVGVFEFVQVWNDFAVGLLLGGPENGLITMALDQQARQFATSAGTTAATAIISLVLPLALVLVTGRWVIRGFTAGVVR